MPASLKTAFLQLNKWLGNENPRRQDFIDDNEKIDAFAKDIENRVDILETVVTTSGIVPAYAVTLDGFTYEDGKRITVKFHAESSQASTLNVTSNGVALGAKSILKQNGTALTSVKAGVYDLIMFGGNFTLSGEGGEYGTATPDKVLTGYTVGTESGLANGTMPNRGSVGTVNLTSEGAEYTIQEGYHNGLGKVKAVITGLVASIIKAGETIGGIVGTFTADATATASQMLNGVTAYVNGIKVTGNIPSKTAQTYTPTTSNQTISAGQYLSGIQTILGDPDLIASNILETANIFGVQGTAKNGAGLKRTATGTTQAGAYPNVNVVVSGLAFTPSKVIGAFITNKADKRRLFVLSSSQDLPSDNGILYTQLSYRVYDTGQAIQYIPSNYTTSGDRITANGFTVGDAAFEGLTLKWWAFE